MALFRCVARWAMPVALALAGAVLTGCGAHATALPPPATSLPPSAPPLPTRNPTAPPTASPQLAPAASPTQDRGAAGVEQAGRGKVQQIEPAATQATLSVEPADGGRALQVWVDGVTGLYAVDMEIEFDASRLQATDADPGTAGVQIQPGQAPTPDFVATNSVDNQAGVIRYVATQLGTKPGFSGKGLVATITWQDDPGPGTATAVTFGKVLMVSRDAQPVDVILKR